MLWIILRQLVLLDTNPGCAVTDALQHIPIDEVPSVEEERWLHH